MAPALDTAALLALLDARELLILPSARAASALRERFDAGQRARNLQAWEPATVLSWDEWAESLWSPLALAGAEDRVLLNRLQEELIWAQLIAASIEGAQLNSGALRELAALARSALELAAAHRAVERLSRSADTYDTRAFAAWQQRFAQHCVTERLLPRALLEAALAKHLREKSIVAPRSLHLAGFEDLSPAQTTLLDLLRADGCKIETHPIFAQAAGEKLKATVLVADPREELRWAMRWIRQRFQERSGALLRIALILPDPAHERAELEPLLRDALAPELECITADLSSAPWSFGDGPALADLPMIQHALMLLRWTREELPLESIGCLLLSPFLGHSNDSESRARFEMHGLRRSKRLRPELSLPALLSLTRTQRRDHLPDVSFPELAAALRLAGDPGQLTAAGSHADWTELIRKILRAAGWPGPRTLSAAEFRATEAWEGLLDLLATLDLGGARVRFEDVLHLLVDQTARMATPNPAATAGVQILRLAETHGCIFDAALVLHATDEQLPAREHANPLLGWGLQRDLGLPGTDPARAHIRGRDSLRGLEHRCGALLLLSAQSNEHGELRLTPLASELGFAVMNPGRFFSPTQEPPPLTLEDAPDSTPLPPLPSPHVSGGARVLKLQSACGFQAFASLRLAAEAPASRSLGLDAREAGNLLHRAMEYFWREVKSQRALKALTFEQRGATIQRCVAQALDKTRDSVPPQQDSRTQESWVSAYLAVFEQRLCNLIHQWLKHELDRGDFTVLPPEQQQTVEIGPLLLRVRPDRIDKVADGFVFVDYKTSSALSTRDWIGERPDEPQLPLYALLGESDEVRGVAFARLRPGGDMTWLSIQDKAGLFPGKRGNAVHNLTEELERWRDELNRLAFDFADGRTSINPKSFPKTCTYCEQRLLCRLDATSLMAGADGDSGEGTDDRDG